jgi:aminopeptidase
MDRTVTKGGAGVTADRIERWAALLVDYCLRVVPGETVVIGSEWSARPLVEASFRAIVDRGGYPLVR